MQKSRGFTIIELIVVIVIIGILSAIVIVSYSGIRTRAAAATLKSDIEKASIQLEKYRADHGAYPATEALANDGAGLSKSSGTTYQYALDGSYYCISASSTSAGSTIYHTTSTSGTAESGECPIFISTPSAPTVSYDTVSTTTTWSWTTPSCVSGTIARYQYKQTITPSGYDSGWVAIADSPVTFTTTDEGQTYNMEVQAQCYLDSNSSDWSTSGSDSYYRPLLANGAVCLSSLSCSSGTCGTDADNDGYLSSSLGQSGVCQATSKPYTDCCDLSDLVNPGIITYSSSINACNSYDYNCDGTEVKHSDYCDKVTNCALPGPSGSCGGSMIGVATGTEEFYACGTVSPTNSCSGEHYYQWPNCYACGAGFSGIKSFDNTGYGFRTDTRQLAPSVGSPCSCL